MDRLFRGQLKIQQRDGYENVKIFNRFNKQNNNFARTFLYISIIPFLHDDDVKMPNCAFYGVREQATTKFYFSAEFGYGPFEFNFKRDRLHLTK